MYRDAINEVSLGRQDEADPFKENYTELQNFKAICRCGFLSVEDLFYGHIGIDPIAITYDYQ